MLPLEIFFSAFLLVMLVQGLVSLYLTLYAWEEPDRLKAAASPTAYEQPALGFTVLLPARHEQAVIGDTIRSISQSNYPSELLQIIMIAEASDHATIAAAQQAIDMHAIPNASVLTFNDGPVNKPHGLNKGLEAAIHPVVVIFDAEDDVNPDIFNIANTLYINKNPDIIQAGVQLMNYSSRWFSSHNVLEYFFWFKSRMHYHAKVGMVPLGGNTVFFKTIQLREIGGWNEQCLTEDAEIGIRMSVKGARILSTYDPAHVTKEETPDSIQQFIKQRTRWNQGFLQVMKYGYWKEYDTVFKRMFCLYTLSFPLVQAALLILTPFVLMMGIYEKMPSLLSLLSFIPILIALVHYIISVVGLHEFIIEQKLPHQRTIYIKMLLTLVPYQIMLGIGAIRATYRELRGQNNWEKTVHIGQHRDSVSSVPDELYGNGAA
jgi:cellulose synthase/poly-beta-1,6-N-acetylglucosamine synthase-like glycosyltransferase